MKTSAFSAMLLCLAAAPLVHAGYGAGDARKEKLYQTFIAPCCWQENLAEHNSPDAQRLRSRIDGMIAEGESDEAIKDALVVEFCPRILALPKGTPRIWLFWTPLVVTIAGLAAIVMALKRLKARQSHMT